MKCKDCEHLVIVDQTEEYNMMQLRCEKYNLLKLENIHTFEYLNCVECQSNFDEVIARKKL